MAGTALRRLWGPKQPKPSTCAHPITDFEVYYSFLAATPFREKLAQHLTAKAAVLVRYLGYQRAQCLLEIISSSTCLFSLWNILTKLGPNIRMQFVVKLQFNVALLRCNLSDYLISIQYSLFYCILRKTLSRGFKEAETQSLNPQVSTRRKPRAGPGLREEPSWWKPAGRRRRRRWRHDRA